MPNAHLTSSRGPTRHRRRRSAAWRLWALEDENRKLKKLLAELMLDQAALKELLTKKWEGPPGIHMPGSAARW